MAARKTGSARAVALPASRRRFDARRLLPTRRSLVVASALVVCAAAAYAAAAETSVFAVTDLEIVGGSPRVQAEVRRALAPELGRSLLRVSDGEIDRRAGAVPDVVSLTFDRRFPPLAQRPHACRRARARSSSRNAIPVCAFIYPTSIFTTRCRCTHQHGLSPQCGNNVFAHCSSITGNGS